MKYHAHFVRARRERREIFRSLAAKRKTKLCALCASVRDYSFFAAGDYIYKTLRTLRALCEIIFTPAALELTENTEKYFGSLAAKRKQNSEHFVHLLEIIFIF